MLVSSKDIFIGNHEINIRFDNFADKYEITKILNSKDYSDICLIKNKTNNSKYIAKRFNSKIKYQYTRIYNEINILKYLSETVTNLNIVKYVDSFKEDRKSVV